MPLCDNLLGDGAFTELEIHLAGLIIIIPFAVLIDIKLCQIIQINLLIKILPIPEILLDPLFAAFKNLEIFLIRLAAIPCHLRHRL